MKNTNEDLQQLVIQYKRDIRELKKNLSDVLNSKSWKITAPLRSIINFSKKNRQRQALPQRIAAPCTKNAADQTLDQFDEWFCSNVKNAPKSPRRQLSTSWRQNTKYGAAIRQAMDEAELVYAADLLLDLQQSGVEGDIVEFGVYKGKWLDHLWQTCNKLGLQKRIIGFDSFEGLPEPGNHDYHTWTKGQFAASYEEVSKSLRINERENLELVKGWFADSFKSAQVRAIDKICYARIDSDLYQPAKECLEYLQPRLVDGAILVLDDWTWDITKSETKALREWLPTSGLQLEFLAHNSVTHVYFIIHKK